MAAEWRRWVVRDMVRALPCRQFEIKLVTQPPDGTHGRCIKTLMLTPDELISEWRQFVRWSAQRLNMFMRPVGGPVHVLLDLAEMLAEAMQRHLDDRSAADFEVACVMLRAGDAPEHVAARLIVTSEKAKEREARKAWAGFKYVQRTVQRAMSVTGIRPRQEAGA